MTRKGEGYAIMFFAFFYLLIVVGGGIVWGTYAFYRGEYDFKKTEAEILSERVYDCFLKEDFFAEDFDFYSICGLNEKVLEDGAHAIIMTAETGEDVFVKGVLDYKNQCFLKGKSKEFPSCVRKEINIDGKNYELITGSNQKSRRVLAG